MTDISKKVQQLPARLQRYTIRINQLQVVAAKFCHLVSACVLEMFRIFQRKSKKAQIQQQQKLNK